MLFPFFLFYKTISFLAREGSGIASHLAHHNLAACLAFAHAQRREKDAMMTNVSFYMRYGSHKTKIRWPMSTEINFAKEKLQKDGFL